MRWLGLGCFFYGVWAMASTSVYCPANHGYVSVGMSTQAVLAACGNPTSKERSRVPFTQKIAMLQLVYNNQGTAKAFYGVWSIPVGITAGSTLTIDVVENKVHAVTLNGGSNKAFSICGGVPILVGDPVSKVYGACGNPSLINNTYITKQVGPVDYPEIWTYLAPYQPAIRLTFVKGKLESID